MENAYIFDGMIGPSKKSYLFVSMREVNGFVASGKMQNVFDKRIGLLERVNWQF